jgi:uncharacterized protein with HXXEE motif
VPVKGFDRLPYRWLQWLVALFLALHNLEEALTMGEYLPHIEEQLSGLVFGRRFAAIQDLSWFYSSLLGATLLPAAVVWAATTGRPSRAKAWAVAFVQSLMLANVLVPHVVLAAVVGGYVPGLVTALGINLPYSIYFLRRTVRDGVLRTGDVVACIAVATPSLVLILTGVWTVGG